MSDPTLSASPLRGILVRGGAVLLIVLSITVATGFWMNNQSVRPTPGQDKPPEVPKQPAVGGQPLFAMWPQNQKPELVLVLTGQTYGYLSPCGCSRPQKGGLERRANFIETLRAKGSPVVGLDLGDVASPKGVHKQNLLKYKTTMLALREMGYAVVGLGEYDFAAQLYELLGAYTLNNTGKPPIILGANLVGVKERGPDGKPTKVFTREQYFPGGGEKDRPMVEGVEVFGGKTYPAVGVVGVVGPEAIEKIEKQDAQFAFLANPQFLPAAIAALTKHPAKPELLILMYGGKLDQAKVAAAANPQFQVVLCQSDDPEPPQFPTLVNNGKTMIIQVGHKGQNVGALGIFKKAGGGVELKYQLVELVEEYLTPQDAEAEKNNKVLQLLEEYTAEVKKQNLLAEHRAKPIPHSVQIQHPMANISYVGNEACAKCHAAEAKHYDTTKHSHAYAALVGAKRPGNRQFDGECIVCHTVGFEYSTGFDDAVKTPHLKNVGCESCHGPGSGHVANPKDAKLLGALSPWKSKQGDQLPALPMLQKLASMKPIERGSVKMEANEAQVVNAVSSMCMKCHDTENDPKFDFFEYFPKIHHTGLKNAGLPPGVVPK